MSRKKFEIGRYPSRCAVEYLIVESTTHKTTLANGATLRTDMNGFFIQESVDGKYKSSWFGCPNLSGGEMKDYDWVEEDYERSYEAEYDYS